MAICRLCALEMEPPPGFVDICSPCANEVGVRPMPPPRRPMRPCMRCNATRFVRAVPREYTAYGAYGSGHVFQRVAPMRLTAVPVVKGRLFFSGNHVDAPNIETHGFGTLEVYACVSCGFVEWYCQDPETIPIGPEFMTELIDVAPKDPYR